jgi:hypothetical protein
MIRVGPDIKDILLARLCQGLIFLPIATVAQWMMRPESPVDPISRYEHEDNTQRRINGSVLFFMGIYLYWIVSFAFKEGPCE